MEKVKIKILGVNLFPMMRKFMQMKSESSRKETVLKQAVSSFKKPILDPYDCTGDNPYNITEIVKDIWQVGYKQENTLVTRPEVKKLMKLFGMGYPDEAYKAKCLEAAKAYGEAAVEQVKDDLKTIVAWMDKPTYSKEEVFTVDAYKLNMFVVKLKSGNLMLYSPVKIHKDAPELIYSWLESLG